MGHWIDCKYESWCSECECDVLAGDRVYYEPNEQTGEASIYCRTCGEDMDQPEDPEVEL